MIGIQISGSGLTGLRDLAARARNPQAMLKEVGRRGANELKAWFRQRNKTPNKLGGRRSNLWLKIADSVQTPVLLGGTRARISVTHPVIMQKVRGGLIRAKRGNWLTIPVAPEAYERPARVFQKETGLRLIFIQKKGSLHAFFAERLQGKGIRIIYLLVKEVDQDRDPQALPPEDKWNAALLDQAQKHLDRQDRPPPTTTP